MHAGVALTLLCAICCVSRRAAAQSAPSLRVLVAQDTCGDASQIEARLLAHDPRLTFADAAGPAGLTLRLSFAARGRALAGQLSLAVGTGPADGVREIVGSSCAEVVEALVLVGLVLIEDAAPSARQPAASLTATPPASEADSPPKPTLSATSQAPAETTRMRMLVAAGAGVVIGQLPRAAGRAQLGGGLELVGGERSVLASARLLAAISGAGDVTIGMEQAGFWSLAGRLELAGPRLRWRMLGAELSGLFELGRLQGVVRRSDGDRAGHALWLAGGGLLRVLLELSRALRLELELGLFGRLRSAEFRFERTNGPPAGVWRVPAWGLQTTIGVAVPFS